MQVQHAYRQQYHKQKHQSLVQAIYFELHIAFRYSSSTWPHAHKQRYKKQKH